MGLKGLETRHIELQHIQNLALNEVNKNKSEFYKIWTEESSLGRKLCLCLY